MPVANSLSLPISGAFKCLPVVLMLACRCALKRMFIFFALVENSLHSRLHFLLARDQQGHHWGLQWGLLYSVQLVIPTPLSSLLCEYVVQYTATKRKREKEFYELCAAWWLWKCYPQNTGRYINFNFLTIDIACKFQWYGNQTIFILVFLPPFSLCLSCSLPISLSLSLSF